MSIAARNGFVVGKRLPYDAEVEWLGFSGTQYIDTGIVPLNTDTLTGSIGAATVGTSTYDYAMGARTATAIYMIRRSPSTTVGFELNALSVYRIVNFSLEELPVAFQLKSGDSFIGSVSVGTTMTTASVSPNTLCIGAVKFNGTVTFSSSLDFRLHGLAIERGGSKIIDFIPVRKGNVGYMFDCVSSELFGNQGTGDFIIGPDI